MTYTPEELKSARITESWRLSDGGIADTMDRLADLYEANWQPPPKVDADTLASRKWMKARTAHLPDSVDVGYADEFEGARAFRAGLAHARATAPNADDVAGLVAAAREVSDRWGPNCVIVPEHIQRLRRALPDSGET